MTTSIRRAAMAVVMSVAFVFVAMQPAHARPSPDWVAGYEPAWDWCRTATSSIYGAEAQVDICWNDWNHKVQVDNGIILDSQGDGQSAEMLIRYKVYLTSGWSNWRHWRARKASGESDVDYLPSHLARYATSQVQMRACRSDNDVITNCDGAWR